MLKRYNNMKMRTKLLVAFLSITIIASLSTIVALLNMGDMGGGNGPQGAAQASQSVPQQMLSDPRMLMIGILIVSYVVSIVIAIAISKNISKPIAEMTKAAQKMAEGDLNVEISVKTKDEVGQLCAALAQSNSSIKAYIADIADNLSRMSKGDLNLASTVEYKGDFKELRNSLHDISVALNQTILQIRQASEQVSSGSGQVSSSSQALAQGATEQASAIEELSATIAEISENVKQNAEFASSASTNVNHVGSELEISNQHMQEMLNAMAKISDSSNEIGKIIKTIEDIAFQTNILALNAAVEAARAGEAGKGFAVVADEVRNLASKSAEAAKDTTSLIQNSIVEVENGTKIADTTANALLKVVGDTKEAANTVDQIAKKSNEQASSINQVTLGVEQISAVVQTNSATAEESAAASEELSGQAQILKDLVENFKLRQKKAKSGDQPKAQAAAAESQPEPQSALQNFANDKY